MVLLDEKHVTEYHLHLRRDVNFCVSIFDYLPLAFHKKFESYGAEPKIVVATSKSEDSWRLTGDGTEQTASSSKIIEFLCTAKVTGVQLVLYWLLQMFKETPVACGTVVVRPHKYCLRSTLQVTAWDSTPVF
uniref:Uncharacterized protein n=1 Tax=Brassica campestris TaxID=3711 RepID=M4DPS4_BRACM